MKSREKYNYDKISEIITAQKLEEKQKREAKEKLMREQRQKEYMASSSM